jgi:hypothetical protein
MEEIFMDRFKTYVCDLCEGRRRITTPWTDEYGNPTYGGWSSCPCPKCEGAGVLYDFDASHNVTADEAPTQ